VASAACLLVYGMMTEFPDMFSKDDKSVYLTRFKCNFKNVSDFYQYLHNPLSRYQKNCIAFIAKKKGTE